MSRRAYTVLFWVGATAVLFVLLGQLGGILMPFAAGFAIAYLLVPAVDRMESWGARRSLAALTILVVFLVGVGVVVVLIVPLVQAEILRTIVRLPGLVNAGQEQFGHLMQLLQKHLSETEVAKVRDLVNAKTGEAVDWLVGLLQSMITSSFAILNILSLAIVTPIVAFFLLRDWSVMVAGIDANLPRGPLVTIREQMGMINQALAGFLHGQAIVCLVLAAYYAIALSLAGLELALAIGLLIGLLAIIPILGVSLGFLLALCLAALQHESWTAIVVVCGIFMFGQTVEANILSPKLVGDRIHLHPVWVIFALLAGGKLLGFFGVLISMPAAAVIGVLARFALERYRRSALYDPRLADPVRRLPPSE